MPQFLRAHYQEADAVFGRYADYYATRDDFAVNMRRLLATWFALELEQVAYNDLRWKAKSP